MADQSLAIAINSRARDLILELGMWEPRGFGPQFSVSLSERLEAGAALGDAIGSSLPEEFRVANAESLEAFCAQLIERLMPILIESDSLFAVITRFKEYAERQLVHGFTKMNNEEFCRSNLQTYLEQAGRSTREVQSGGGWIDVVVASGEPVEAKLWRGPEYYAEGVEELHEYMRTEQQATGYYVVFDTIADNAKLQEFAQIEDEIGLITQVAVRMSPGPPSKIRKSRRRNTSGD